MIDAQSFSIKSDKSAIDDLRDRLKGARWPEPECVEDWSQGVPIAYLRELVEYWRTDYDFAAREARLNNFPNYITTIDGLEIHFIHQPSPHKEARPLLITHGWPGSVLEFLSVIGPLTDPVAHGGDAKDAFHVICPSLPGFGYSGKPTETGWGVERIAEAWDKLMVGLGYDRYLAQGGDWGSFVTRTIAAQNRGHCFGIHINLLVAPVPEAVGKNPGPEDQNAFESLQYHVEHGSGYAQLQKTRPQTISYALTDSPIGQLAWILEKFYDWTDCDGHPENAIPRDEILDHATLYWLTASAGSSAKLYWEESDINIDDDASRFPVGYTLFPKEIFQTPKHWAESRFRNLVYFNEVDKGGHFAASEQPELFVEELRRCFGKM